MNKLIISCGLMMLMIFLACNRKPFVEHKLKLEDAGRDCNQLKAEFRMISNFGGERFEFEKCLPPDFSNEKIQAERKGDTVVLRFPNTGDISGNKLFKVTLDIDSYPRYGYLTIDEETYSIIPAGNK